MSILDVDTPPSAGIINCICFWTILYESGASWNHCWRRFPSLRQQWIPLALLSLLLLLLLAQCKHTGASYAWTLSCLVCVLPSWTAVELPTKPCTAAQDGIQWATVWISQYGICTVDIEDNGMWWWAGARDEVRVPVCATCSLAEALCLILMREESVSNCTRARACWRQHSGA